MALTLGQGAQVVTSLGYQNRVRTAMVQVSIDVSAEAQGGMGASEWAKRRQLATRVLNSPDSTLPSFLAAFAADPNSSLSWFSPVTITSSTNANPTVLTTQTHGLVDGDVVEVVGHLVNTAANGIWVVDQLSATTFSIPQAANGVGANTGTVMKMVSDNDILFTLSSVFSAIAGKMPGD